jgi:hypothetical protein
MSPEGSGGHSMANLGDNDEEEADKHSLRESQWFNAVGNSEAVVATRMRSA